MRKDPSPPVRRLLVVAMLAAAWPIACDHGATGKEEQTMTFTLTSPAFKDQQRIPTQHTGEGADTSPPLAWSAPPAGTKALALLCEDPDAPVGTWDHWLVWNLPGDLRSLPEGVAKTAELPDLGGARQGSNSWPKIGYYGPMPPKGHGTHHYHFILYALDAPLDLKAGAKKPALAAAMKGRILGQARLVGTYSR